MMGLGHLPVLTQPNPENKLFVGGAPPGTDEYTLKNIFEEHGEVEEVFLMRGGSLATETSRERCGKRAQS